MANSKTVLQNKEPNNGRCTNNRPLFTRQQWLTNRLPHVRQTWSISSVSSHMPINLSSLLYPFTQFQKGGVIRSLKEKQSLEPTFRPHWKLITAQKHTEFSLCSTIHFIPFISLTLCACIVTEANQTSARQVRQALHDSHSDDRHP